VLQRVEANAREDAERRRARLAVGWETVGSQRCTTLVLPLGGWIASARGYDVKRPK